MVMVLFEDIQQGKNVNKLHSKRKSDRIVTENIKPELGGSGFKKQRDSGESDYSEDTINPTIADSSNFRNDVNANGVISNTDVSTTKAQVGRSLP